MGAPNFCQLKKYAGGLQILLWTEPKSSRLTTTDLKRLLPPCGGNKHNQRQALLITIASIKD